MQLLRAKSLSYLVVPPAIWPVGQAGSPVLCFLHGLCEAAPAEIRQALALHGPLRHRETCQVIRSFGVVAPQLPTPESRWRDRIDDVIEIVRAAQRRFCGDPQRTVLTGFSYGADGLFEVAEADPGLWSALWAVDPTRVPSWTPTRPTWLSLGELSRAERIDFEQRLGGSSSGGGDLTDSVCEDRGLDHVGTATAAYQDEQVYAWLLRERH